MCEYHLAHEREGIDLVEFKQYYLLWGHLKKRVYSLLQ